MVAGNRHSTAALSRLAFRLGIALLFSIGWPGDAPARAAGILCLVLAVGSLWAALALGEAAKSPGFNRWHEAAFLAGLGLILLFAFGSRVAPL